MGSKAVAVGSLPFAKLKCENQYIVWELCCIDTVYFIRTNSDKLGLGAVGGAVYKWCRVVTCG